MTANDLTSYSLHGINLSETEAFENKKECGYYM